MEKIDFFLKFLANLPDLKPSPPLYSEISQTVKIAIHKVSYTDFHKHYGNIEKLLEIALPLTMVVTRENLALDSIRPTVEKCVRVSLPSSPSMSDKFVSVLPFKL